MATEHCGGGQGENRRQGIDRPGAVRGSVIAEETTKSDPSLGDGLMGNAFTLE